MCSNNEEGYILYKSQSDEKLYSAADDRRSGASSGAKRGERGTTITIATHLSNFSGILYHYLIVSLVYSLSSQCFHSDGPTDKSVTVEMNNFDSGLRSGTDPKGKPKRALQSEKARRDKYMKERIKFHFQSHLQKWKRLHFPFKVTLHLLLVVIVTIQVFLFAQSTSKFTRFVMGSQEAFELYFKRTKCSEEMEKLYKLEDVYNQITLIVDSYYNISEQAVGSFRHFKDDDNATAIPPTLTMKIDYYSPGCDKDESKLFPHKELTRLTHLFPYKHDNDDDDADLGSSRDESCCYTETTDSRCSLEFCDCNIDDQIKCYINGSNINRVKAISFNFTLFTFFRAQVIEDKASVNAEFDIQIELKNDLYSSMTIDIKVDSTLRRYCDGYDPKISVLDIVIITLLILSSLTYFGSVIGTYRLAKDMKLHFLAYHKRRLRWTEISVLYNKWYIFMIFTNKLILMAIIAKLISDYTEEIQIQLVECARILLGIGVFLLWCGLFGLLSYFESLNVLFITVRLAIPSVLRFSICVLILFIAFELCGWLILGPYHPKFEDFSLSMESLFCILCGDDLYTTFELVYTNTDSRAIRFFSNLYLISFIFIFIYAVLSLFIGIFNHAYDTLSENWKQYSRGFLRDWAEGEHENDPTKSYPFPVPPVRDPTTDIDTCQAVSIPTLVVNADQDELLTDHNPTQQLQSNVGTHLNVIKNVSTRSSSVRVQVAKPPVATRNEVNDARFKLRGYSMLDSKDFKDDGSGDDDGEK